MVEVKHHLGPDRIALIYIVKGICDSLSLH